MRPTALAVIGLGAIGGSVAWQARRAGVRHVVGYSPHPAETVAAAKADAISDRADTPERAVRGADLVILAVPPRATVEVIRRLAPLLEPGALLTDVASVKAAVVDAACAAGIGGRFAGGHPLAGTHGSGFEHARPDRFRGCVVYVCDTGAPGGDDAARAVAGFWREVMEAEPVLIDPGAHDRQLAWTSHLPQVTASALAHVLAGQGLAGVSYGPGARDTTRLAASSPDLWTDILLENQQPVAGALRQLERALAELRGLVEARDERGLRRFLEAAAAFRRGIDR